jgi:saccharopine dehydrogenase (NAD+, L-lysine-forming)
MSKVLIIGAGGVGQVVTHKCAQRRDIFTGITLASRTESKCGTIAAQVDADNVLELVGLIKKVQPKLVINVALPYQLMLLSSATVEV